MSTIIANGKLLISGEYLILNGAKSLAVPCNFNQSLEFHSEKSNYLHWHSYDNNNNEWFSANFHIENLNLASSSDHKTGEWLEHILKTALKIANKNPLNGGTIKTFLSFPRDWGLGSSSTLISNIATLFKIDPYKLHFSSTNGSGYDIACATNNQPILYQLKEKSPIVETIHWQPPFAEEINFIHLNKKQKSHKEISRFKKMKINSSTVNEISNLTLSLTTCTNLNEFEEILNEHEKITGNCINQKPIKESYFSNYEGAIKSLGAWGGDFILVTRNNTDYFKSKGFSTILKYKEMVKSNL